MQIMENGRIREMTAEEVALRERILAGELPAVEESEEVAEDA